MEVLPPHLCFYQTEWQVCLGGVVCYLGNNEWKLCSLQSQLKPKLLPAWDSIQYAAPLDQKPCDLLWIALKSLGQAKAKLILHRNSASQ